MPSGLIYFAVIVTCMLHGTTTVLLELAGILMLENVTKHQQFANLKLSYILLRQNAC